MATVLSDIAKASDFEFEEFQVDVLNKLLLLLLTPVK